MKPLRIGVSAHATRGLRSGLGHYVRNLLEACARCRPEHRYVVFCNEREADDLRSSLDTSRVRFHTSARVWDHALANIAYHNTVMPYLAKRYRLDALLIAVDRRMPLIRTVPTVATVHDLAPWHVSGKYASSRQLYNTLLLPLVLKRCSRLIAISRSTARDLGRFTGCDPRRMHVVHHGVDHGRFAPRDGDGSAERILARYGLQRPYCIYPARLEHPGKNHAALIRALRQACDRGARRIPLACVGAPWRNVSAIHEAVRQEGMADMVRFTGFVADGDLPHLLRSAEFMVFPSLHEGFGLPVLEAMAAGVPVACSATSSLPELVGDAALLFDPCSEDSISAAIQLMSDDGALRADLAQRGLRRVARFDWNRTARETLAILEAEAARAPLPADSPLLDDIRKIDVEDGQRWHRTRSTATPGRSCSASPISSWLQAVPKRS